MMEEYLNRVDPCCGVPLKRGAKFIAMIDMINSIGTGVFVGFSLVVVLFYGDEIQIALDKDRAEFPDEAGLYEYFGTGIVLWVLLLTLLTSVLYFVLAQTLLHGAQQKDAEKVTRWIHITVVLLCLRVGGLIFGTFLAKDSFGLIFFGFLTTLYTLYCVWVVFRFRNELFTGEALILTQWDHHHPRSTSITVPTYDAFKM